MEIKSFVLTSPFGDQIHLSNYGARILKWYTTIDNVPRNIVLGYSKLEDYLTDASFMGAIVGPYANRIKNATFSIAGTKYYLDSNIKPHHLHGGALGLGELIWQHHAQDEESVTFLCQLNDGYNGYPGDTTFTVTYRLTCEQINNCALSITIKVESNQKTVAGPTTHPYFNLSVCDDSKSADGHQLQVFSDYFTQTDNDNVPTGELVHVADGVDRKSNGQLDFRQARLLSADPTKDILDHNFLINDYSKNSKSITHAILVSPDKKLQLEVDSSYPAIQIYTGQHLQTPFSAFQGICLEPQFCPNSPNQSAFPFSYTTPEQPLEKEVIYRLVKKN